MDRYARRRQFTLLALIVITLGVLVYICSHTEPGVTFMQYISRSDKISRRTGISSRPEDKPAHVRVVDYSTFPMVDEIECVPLKTALHDERICVYDDTTDSYVSKSLRLTGVWEPHIFKLLSRIVAASPGLDCQFLDIGSNIGVYAVTLASMGRTVVAVEPLYNNLLRLTKSIRLNKMENKVTIVTNPVSDVHENVSLWVPDDNVGGTRVASKGITLGRIPDGHMFHKAPEEVPTIHLDELLPLISFKKAIMKVDIEGYEMKAFKRAARLFDAIEITHVFMEWGRGKQTIPLYDMRPMIDFFEGRGYAAHNMDLTVLPSGLEGFRQWPLDLIWVRRTK